MQLKYGIIGTSNAMKNVIERLVQAAPTDLSVLIGGETGTGKEVFANALHGLSNRSKQQFISVNCGAIPETLLESELFGHEKGAFTGAIEQRKGFFEVADKGTIFLDEIGEMPLGTQVKLLRVLESGEFIRLGSTEIRKVDARVIAASNRDLEYEVRKGNFRQDLFFRLNSVQIFLPPLRERLEDIDELVEHFAVKVSDKLGLKYDGISPEALLMLKSLPWPGNIRELKNLIETLVTLEQTTYIDAEILKRYMPLALPPADFEEQITERALVPIKKENAGTSAEFEIIFRTLLDLKHDLNEIKHLTYNIQSDIEQVKADVIDMHPEAGHQLYVEDMPQFDESNIRLEFIEKQLIEFALKKYAGNRKNAASALGISERTLYRKLLEYNLD